MGGLLIWERENDTNMVGKYEYKNGCFKANVKYDHIADQWYVSFSGRMFPNETHKDLDKAVDYAEISCSKFANSVNQVIRNETKASEAIEKFLESRA